MPSSGFQLSALPEITATPAANAGVYDPVQSMKAMEASIALFKQLQNAQAAQQAEQSGFNLQTASNKAKTPIQGVLAGAQGAEAEAAIPEAKNRGVLAGLNADVLANPDYRTAYTQSKVLAPIQAGGAAAATINEQQTNASLLARMDAVDPETNKTEYAKASDEVNEANKLSDPNVQDSELAAIQNRYPWLNIKGNPKADALRESIKDSRDNAQKFAITHMQTEATMQGRQIMGDARRMAAEPAYAKLVDLYNTAVRNNDPSSAGLYMQQLEKLDKPSGRMSNAENLLDLETKAKKARDDAATAHAGNDPDEEKFQSDLATVYANRAKVLTTRATGNTISAEDIKALAAGLGGGTAKAAPAGAPAGTPTAAAATATNPDGGKSNATPLSVQQASQLPPGTWFMGTDQKWHKRK